MLRALGQRDIALVTGKGGVGKTTVSVALAHAAVAAGRTAVIAEIAEHEGDPSPLGQAFGLRTLPQDPVTVAPGIQALSLYAPTGHERFLRDAVQNRILVNMALGAEPVTRFFRAAPSAKELGVFYHLLTLVRNPPRGRLLIVDFPATGHALGMVRLPDLLLDLMPVGPLARALREGQKIFLDPQRTGAVVVSLTESLPITEGLELIAGLRAARVSVAGMVVNRVVGGGLTESDIGLLESRLLDKKVLGRDWFFRWLESRAALARLQTNAEHPIISIPQLTGDDVARRVAQEFA